jgi:hypothetical protein
MEDVKAKSIVLANPIGLRALDLAVASSPGDGMLVQFTDASAATIDKDVEINGFTSIDNSIVTAGRSGLRIEADGAPQTATGVRLSRLRFGDTKETPSSGGLRYANLLTDHFSLMNSSEKNLASTTRDRFVFGANSVNDFSLMPATAALGVVSSTNFGFGSNARTIQLTGALTNNRDWAMTKSPYIPEGARQRIEARHTNTGGTWAWFVRNDTGGPVLAILYTGQTAEVTMRNGEWVLTFLDRAQAAYQLVTADADIAVRGAGQSAKVIEIGGAHARNMTITLSLTGAIAGDEVLFTFTYTNTGGPWNTILRNASGSGTILKTAQTAQWARAVFNGTAWMVTAQG